MQRSLELYRFNWKGTRLAFKCPRQPLSKPSLPLFHPNSLAYFYTIRCYIRNWKKYMKIQYFVDTSWEKKKMKFSDSLCSVKSNELQVIAWRYLRLKSPRERSHTVTIINLVRQLNMTLKDPDSDRRWFLEKNCSSSLS